MDILFWLLILVVAAAIVYWALGLISWGEPPQGPKLRQIANAVLALIVIIGVVAIVTGWRP